MIYLDANATTIMPPEVIKQMIAWTNKGNPSSDYKTAKLCQQMMIDFRDYIAANCNFVSFEPDRPVTKNVYQIIFNSCASESNNTIIRSATTSYKFNMKTIPHVITSSIEHKSLLLCVEQLQKLGSIELTLVAPDQLGFVRPEDVEAAIKHNTCIISIMHANNELGTINNIAEIGKVAHKYKIPFHTDAVQTFGKYLLDLIKSSVDAFSVSFHKLHGPPGVGALIIKRQYIDNFHLLPEICGTQNCSIRGGTENVPGIAASFEGTRITWTNRANKNKHLLKIKTDIIKAIGDKIPMQTYYEYCTKPRPENLFVVIISPAGPRYMLNTIFLSIVKRTEPAMCNIQIKKMLEKKGIIVSIGSACNTSSDKASHVLHAIGADSFIRKGALRISADDNITAEQADKFVTCFVESIKEFVAGQQ
jgi:cysteine desulfurase